MTVRVGFVGLGRAALHHHWPHIAGIDGVEIVGGCDPDPARRAHARDACGLPFVTEDAEELLVRARPDVVNVCSPPDSHAGHCLLALRHRAHVFCEKPFVQSLEEADRVIAAARAAGRVVAVNTQYRSLLASRAAKDEIASPGFGRLLFVQAWQRIYRTPETEGGWRAALRRRTLFEFGTHVLDLIHFFYEMTPQSVYAQMPRSLPGVEADLIDVVTLGFPDGRGASIVFDRVYHGPERYLEMLLDGERASVRLSLDHAGQRVRAWRLVKGEATLLAEESGHPWGEATGRHFRRFLQSLERGEAPETGAAAGRRVMAVCFAAYESAARGEVLRLQAEGVPHGG